MASRRTFIRQSMAISAGLSLGVAKAGDSQVITPPFTGPIVLSTWDFGLAANEVAMATIIKGGNALDAVEAGVRVSEADASITSVGKGGFPDAEGDVTLDACIMDHNARCGAVACLEKILHPISVARAVMERTPHVFLVGEKAGQFARSLGFPKENLLTSQSKKAWKQWKADNPKWKAFSTDISNHDTIGMIAMDKAGNISGACTTSGWAFKLPGRVGDSPIIGAGLYVDNEIGAATSTGTGEEVIRICGSFLIVELMRLGYSPTDACKEAVRRIKKNNPEKPDLFVGFIALKKTGEYGAWSTVPGLTYAVATEKDNKLYHSNN